VRADAAHRDTGLCDLSLIKNVKLCVTPQEPFEKLAGGGDPVPIITLYQGASGSGQELAEAVAGVLGLPLCGTNGAR
jgi:hypothetical protein